MRDEQFFKLVDALQDKGAKIRRTVLDASGARMATVQHGGPVFRIVFDPASGLATVYRIRLLGKTELISVPIESTALVESLTETVLGTE